MSKTQTLRGLIEQRLSLAAEEIFELFERTIAEYEEQLSRSKEESERQQKLLEAIYNPEVRLHRADVQQLNEDQEQQPSPSLDQEDPPKLPHIKEEEVKQGSSQEGEQPLGVKEEEDFKVFTFTPSLKFEEDGEKPQTSQLYEIQTEEIREEASQSSESDTDDSCLYPDIMNSQSGLNPDHNSDVSDSDVKNTSRTSAHSSERPTSFRQKVQLLKHKRNKKRPKRHSCSVCNKTFPCKSAVERHMTIHTGERRFHCSICDKSFTQMSTLTQHLRVHREEKPFTCPVCNKSLSRRHNLNIHMRVHTGEKPFSCLVCGKRFPTQRNMKLHSVVHRGEKPYGCSICGNTYTQRGALKRHMVVHME